MKDSLTVILLFLAAASLLGFVIQLVSWLIERKDD
jgi:hypothetical protein